MEPLHISSSNAAWIFFSSLPSFSSVLLLEILASLLFCISKAYIQTQPSDLIYRHQSMIFQLRLRQRSEGGLLQYVYTADFYTLDFFKTSDNEASYKNDNQDFYCHFQHLNTDWHLPFCTENAFNCLYLCPQHYTKAADGLCTRLIKPKLMEGTVAAQDEFSRSKNTLSSLHCSTGTLAPVHTGHYFSNA